MVLGVNVGIYGSPMECLGEEPFSTCCISSLPIGTPPRSEAQGRHGALEAGSRAHAGASDEHTRAHTHTHHRRSKRGTRPKRGASAPKPKAVDSAAFFVCQSSSLVLRWRLAPICSLSWRMNSALAMAHADSRLGGRAKDITPPRSIARTCEDPRDPNRARG